MTISSTTRKAGPFFGNGVTTVFPFSFKVFKKQDLTVTLTSAAGVESTLILDSTYSVTLNADQDETPGGSVNYPISGDPLAEGQKLTTLSALPNTQLVELSNQGGFYPETVEMMVDRATIQIQQLDEKVSRTIQYPVSDPEIGVTLPPAELRAGKILTFDEAGAPIAVTPFAGSIEAFTDLLASPTGASMVGFQQTGTGAVLRTLQDKAREWKTPYDFGCVGDGTTDDTANFQKFINAVSFGYIPPGLFKITSTLTTHSDLTLHGAGRTARILWAHPAPPPSTAIFSSNVVSRVSVQDIEIQADPDTYPSALCFFFFQASDCHLRDISFQGAGGTAVYANTITRCRFDRFHLDDYRDNGLYFDGAVDCTVEGWQIPDGSGGKMGIQVIRGSNNRVQFCHVAKTPDNYFGITMVQCQGGAIHGNHVRNTRREAITMGGNAFGCHITDNTMIWTENLGVGDFGMSVQGDDDTHIFSDAVISGNTIIQSALNGIGIAGWAQRLIVANNVIRDCSQSGATDFRAGIKLYGSTTQDNKISGNYVSNVLSANMDYAVDEFAPASGTLCTDNKSLGVGGTGYRLTSSTSRQSLSSKDLETIIFTPTVSASSGAITTAAASLRYQTVGKFVHCRITVTITTNGTGAGSVRVTLPFNAIAGSGMLSGRENNATGKVIVGTVSSANLLSIFNYDNTYPGANNAALVLTGILEIV